MMECKECGEMFTHTETCSIPKLRRIRQIFGQMPYAASLNLGDEVTLDSIENALGHLVTILRGVAYRGQKEHEELLQLKLDIAAMGRVLKLANVAQTPRPLEPGESGGLG